MLHLNITTYPVLHIMFCKYFPLFQNTPFWNYNIIWHIFCTFLYSKCSTCLSFCINGSVHPNYKEHIFHFVDDSFDFISPALDTRVCDFYPRSNTMLLGGVCLFVVIIVLKNCIYRILLWIIYRTRQQFSFKLILELVPTKQEKQVSGETRSCWIFKAQTKFHSPPLYYVEAEISDSHVDSFCFRYLKTTKVRDE